MTYTKSEMKADKERLVKIFEEAQDQVSGCATKARGLSGPEAMAFQSVCTKKLVPKAVGEHMVEEELSQEEIEKIKPIQKTLE